MVDDFSTSDVEIELVSLEGFSSKIWKYFGFLGKNGQYKRKHDEVMYCNVTIIAETSNNYVPSVKQCTCY